MCGIVGYIGHRGTLQVLTDGLARLEYRGYDSAGVAFRNGRGVEVCKTKGKVIALRSMLPDPALPITVGLGHTRWATHGAPSSINAHPHCAGGVIVVHNGIIENHRELRSRLVAEGCEFLSETDTEVVPHLIAHSMRGGLSLRDAVRAAASHLQGSYALGIMSECGPDTLFAVRRGSPLVIGIGPGEYYFASDIPALLPYTKQCIFMEDGQVCALTPEGIELQHLESGTIIPLLEQAREIDWSPATAEKCGHDHFMHKEIHEQPQAVRDTLREWIDDTDRLLDDLHVGAAVKDLRRLHIAACGTSYHASLVGRYLIEKFVRIPVAVDIASEFRYMCPVIPKGTLFVSITQSGETADTLAAQREAKSKGAHVCTICNVVDSTSTREADSVLYTRAGPEIGVASTKAFTSQLAALCLLGSALGIKKGRLHPVEFETLKSFLSDLPRLMEQTLRIEGRIRDIAKTLLNATSMLYLGRGINYPVALEGALKMKELSYIHAEGYPAGEMKHGPIALIEEGVPVVFLAPIDDLHEKVLSNVEEVKARGGRVIAITDSPASFMNKADEVIVVPPTHPVLQPFVAAVPLQLLAYHVAVMKGCDVDQPRNLAKSVTVE